jgi:hypothetical protein
MAATLSGGIYRHWRQSVIVIDQHKLENAQCPEEPGSSVIQAAFNARE